MNPDRFRRVKDLAFEVADLSEEERRAHLEIACRGDPELRKEVEELLAHDGKVGQEENLDSLVARALEAIPPPTRWIGQTISHYKILELLGEGGMGQVFRARDTRLDRDVAFKVISPLFSADAERIRRFEQEARAAGSLNHPNIIAIYDIGVHENVPFEVMELLDGASLRQRLKQGPIPIRKAIDYAAQTARGLAAAHAKGVIHRDIKPENLFLTKDGRVKILDFGVAKLMRTDVVAVPEAAKAGDSLTGSGAIIGTSGYMSPEQAQGHSADARSDIFALGATLYEMLTGNRTFQKDSFIATLHAIVNEDPAPMAASGREIPAGIEEIVRHCLEKNPEERFQSAADLAFALEGISERKAGKLGTADGSAGRSVSVKIGLVTAGLLLGALLVAAIGMTTAGHHRGVDASRLEFTRLTAQRGSIVSARFSGDGKTIFYTAMWNGHPAETFETRPGYPAPRSLGLPETSLLSVSRDGRMAVKIGTRDSWMDIWGAGTIAEVPISGGAPRKILDDVQWADWSPDGRTLAVSRNVDGELRLEMPPGHVLYKTAAMILDVRISPDARYVTFTEHPAPLDVRGFVVIVDAAGRTCARSSEWSTCYGLAWSRDGREVWFCGSKDTESSDLRAITTGGKERLVARLAGNWCLMDAGQNGQALLLQVGINCGIRGRGSETGEHELEWFDYSLGRDVSADGRVLLFDEQGIYGGPLYAVCLRGMDGSAPVRLGEGSARALSPDGKWALAIHYGPPQRLLLLPTGVGDTRSLPRGTVEKYYEGSWMPAAKRVLFIGSEPGRARRSFIQDIEGGLPWPITPEGIAGSTVSPDGEMVAAVSEDQRLVLCTTRGESAGSGRFVAQLSPQEELIRWAADGRSIFVGRLGTSASVTRIDVKSGERTFWGRFSVPDSAGVYVVKIVLTPNGRSYAFSYQRILADLYLVDGLK